MTDHYRTIAKPVIGEHKAKGSRFIAYAYSVSTEKEWQQRLGEVQKLHPKASHHCYAYRLGVAGKVYRANDDGEPSNTAGKPILGQLRSFDVSNVIVIVVRYFGGTLLGASGLIQAYKAAAMVALQQASIKEEFISDIYRLTFEYAIMSDVMNGVKRLKLPILHQDFGNIGIIEIAIRQSEVTTTLPLLKATIAKVPIEIIESLGVVPSLKVEYLETR